MVNVIIFTAEPLKKRNSGAISTKIRSIPLLTSIILSPWDNGCLSGYEAPGRRWQMITQVATVLSIWAFVFLTGMSASVVRSAIMLTVYALLALGHRQKMSVNTLAFTAIVMLLVTPKALFDVGFQMSFMAVFSILLFVPLFYRPFSAEYLMTHRAVSWLWGIVAVSVAAQIGVAPLIAYYFGRFSCYFLLTNFIVIPAATLILYLALGTLLIPSLGVLNTTLLYIATIPGATIEGLHPSVGLTVAIYGVLLAAYYLLWLTVSNFRGYFFVI